MDKEARKYKGALAELVGNVERSIAAFDDVMKEPSTNRRGKKIATILNFLDMANDGAMHFGLDWGFKKIENFKKRESNGIQ